MYAERHVVTLVTDGDGAATGYTPVITGCIITVRYVKTDYVDGVDVAVTAEATGEEIWTGTNVNAAVTVAPRQATHSTVGAAALYAAGGVAVLDHIVVAKDRVKIVIASGGATKTGAFHVVVA